MAARYDNKGSRDGGWTDFFWNLVGGAMVSGMLAGMLYVLVAMLAQYLNHNETYWETHYLKLYFIAIFAAYILMPMLLANALGFFFGKKPKSMQSKSSTRK